MGTNTLYAATWQRLRKRWNDPRNEPHYGQRHLQIDRRRGHLAAINEGFLPPGRGRIVLTSVAPS